MEIKKVYNAKDELEANMLATVLEEAGIKSHIQDPGMGQYLDVTMGFSTYGKDIFVDENKVDEAKKIIDEALSNSEESEYEEGIVIPWYKNKNQAAHLRFDP